jgi:hypothetical protein
MKSGPLPAVPVLWPCVPVLFMPELLFMFEWFMPALFMFEWFMPELFMFE